MPWRDGHRRRQAVSQHAASYRPRRLSLPRVSDGLDLALLPLGHPGTGYPGMTGLGQLEKYIHSSHFIFEIHKKNKHYVILLYNT